jgi:hypothetical protein
MLARTTMIVVAAGLFFAGLGCKKNEPIATRPKGSTAAHDFSTPEGAILCLEDAIRKKDIEAAVLCKDFEIEARLMLKKLGGLPGGVVDDQLIRSAAETLELAYRAELENGGFPDLRGTYATFPKTEPYEKGIVVVTEVGFFPDGTTSMDKLLVAQTPNGWRVLNAID